MLMLLSLLPGAEYDVIAGNSVEPELLCIRFQHSNRKLLWLWRVLLIKVIHHQKQQYLKDGSRLARVLCGQHHFRKPRWLLQRGEVALCALHHLYSIAGLIVVGIDQLSWLNRHGVY